jgi:PIN domain nuclease of toxin-antitoxin system
MNYVLDACAMIALLLQEPGEEVVWARLLEDDAVCFAHSLNLCEVFYDFYRDSGEAAASGAVEDLKWLGVDERNDLDEAFWREAGILKGTHRRVSLADCCAITLTRRVGGTLLTSDHHELDPLAAIGVCPITFIR